MNEERRWTSHERQAGRPWDDSYREGPAPWDVGRPQAAVLRLIEAGAFHGQVLDAGCGTGENTLAVAGQGLEVLGVDIAGTAVEIARTKARERRISAEFLVADAFRLADLERRFTTVLDCALFHTCDADERPSYAASLAAATKPGGTLYVLCFSDSGPNLGPHPVARSVLYETFTPESGWAPVSIVPEQLETRFHDDGASAWLASFGRVP